MGVYDETIGTLLLGIFFNTFLYGLVMYQFSSYYRAKWNDPPATRYMVLFMCVLDTFHSASVIYMAWSYVVTNYANPAALAVSEWPQTFTPLATALTALITQIYLGTRIWYLTDNKILYSMVIVLAVPSFILGMTVCIKASIIKLFCDESRVTPLAIAWLSMQVAVDTFIAVTLVIIFTRWRTSIVSMDTVFNRLIRGAIQTGLFSGIFATATLVTFVLSPQTRFYLMFAIPIGRIYTITLLDTLLVRESLRAISECRCNVSGADGTLRWAHPSASATVQSTNVQPDMQRTVQEV